MKPIDYLKTEYHDDRHWKLLDRSKKIKEYFDKYVDKNDTILELGCSSGRNLVELYKVGYKKLNGLEMFPVKQLPEFKLIKERYEDYEHKEYDIIFSASFLQEFERFPQEQFNKTLQKTKKYFMIFGDYLGNWEHPGFKIIEKTNPDYPFSEPIIILKKYGTN